MANDYSTDIPPSGQTQDQLTRNLEAMIHHQRLAEQSSDQNQQDYHHREALRYRMEASRLERQIKTTRLLLKDWVTSN